MRCRTARMLRNFERAYSAYASRFARRSYPATRSLSVGGLPTRLAALSVSSYVAERKRVGGANACARLAALSVSSGIPAGHSVYSCPSRGQRAQARVVEWQTRRSQKPLGETSCEFDPRLGHQVFGRPRALRGRPFSLRLCPNTPGGSRHPAALAASRCPAAPGGSRRPFALAERRPATSAAS